MVLAICLAVPNLLISYFVQIYRKNKEERDKFGCNRYNHLEAVIGGLLGKAGQFVRGTVRRHHLTVKRNVELSEEAGSPDSKRAVKFEGGSVEFF